MDTLTSIKAFRQVVESGSFVAAAERLEVSKAMVSRRVMHVEQRLGVRLLNRNSRKLSLTEPGRLYFERCKTILEDLQATELELGSLSRAPRGTLRITLPSFTVGGRLPTLLAEYGRLYPEVLVDVSFEDRFVDLIEEGYDIALRVVSDAESLPQALIARPIRRATFYLAASREYVKRRGTPNSPRDLSGHDFVAVDNLNFLPPIPTSPRIALRYRSTGAVAHAIAAGIGIGPIPKVIFEDPVFKDVLIPILPEYPLQEATLYLVYMTRKFVSLKIRTFVDFILESFSPLATIKVAHSCGSRQGLRKDLMAAADELASIARPTSSDGRFNQVK
jgi:DNA-binding transcriptional LysR family regulator